MTELYTQTEISAVRRRLIRWRVIAALIVCAALACCVYLALTVTTATEGRNEVAVKRCYDVRVYDYSTGDGILSRFVGYVFPDGSREDCYLCFGAKSLHFAANDGAVDAAAVTVAGNMLRIPRGAKTKSVAEASLQPAKRRSRMGFPLGEAVTGASVRP